MTVVQLVLPEPACEYIEALLAALETEDDRVVRVGHVSLAQPRDFAPPRDALKHQTHPQPPEMSGRPSA